MRSGPPQQGWRVLVKGEWVDTVWFDANMDADAVRRSLIDHDSYPIFIEVEKLPAT